MRNTKGQFTVNNLTGKKFGRLLVLKKSENIKAKGVFWFCVCDCGGTKNISGANLTKEHGTLSCGCLAKELSKIRREQAAKDITGQKFKMLTAVRFSKRVKNVLFWIFKCECGKEKEMKKGGVVSLKSNTLSCGCYSKKINSERIKGDKNPKWSGGVNSPLVPFLRSIECYRQWRNEVLKRDNYTCQFCEQVGGHNLHVDHIKPFALIISENNVRTLEDAMSCAELWMPENGRVLCAPCHRKTDTYARTLAFLSKEKSYAKL